jgi:chromosome partitioning protein
MILTVGNTKGGVGKTLLAVNIAAVLAARGNDVLLIDGDEQSSAATFAQIRSELAVPAKFTTVQLQGAAIRQQTNALRAKYPKIIIDVGGRDSGSLRAALTVSDAILIPFQPRSVDLWAGVQIGALVAEARAVNDLKAYAVINAADAQGRDNDDAMAALGTIEGVEVLSEVIGRRKAFPNAFTAGLAVTEQHPPDAKAVAELLSTVDALYAQRVDNDHQNALRQAG